MLSKNEVKYIQSLAGKKERQLAGCFIAEGPKAIADFLDSAPQLVQRIFALPRWLETHGSTLPHHVQLTVINDMELQKITQLKTPQQALALISLPSSAFTGIPAGKWSLLLNGIQDPGNLGTIIRTADWFGITHVFCTPGTADCYNPKVVQATMGSLLRTTLIYGDDATMLNSYKGPVYGAFMEGENALAMPKPLPGVLVIGQEGGGIQADVLPFITRRITIPRSGQAESLNAAVAAGILMAKFT